MNRSLWARLKQSLTAAEQWYRTTPERALNEAYEAAQAIKRLEIQYANGQTINAASQGEGAVSTYLQTQINKHLKTIRMRLTEYKFCSPVVDAAPPQSVPQSPNLSRTPLSSTDNVPAAADYTLSTDPYIAVSAATVDVSQEILAKLQFIDSVLIRYEPWRSPQSLSTASDAANLPVNGQSSQSLRSVQDSFYNFSSPPNNRKPGKTEGTSFIPRSILKTADRFRRELDPTPQTEEEVVQNFRTARVRTRAATRFLLLLIILPLLTQQVSKALVIGPIVDHLHGTEQIEAWVNPRVEEKFLTELMSYEEKLKFQNLVLETSRSPKEMEVSLKEKAVKLKENFQKELKEPVKNVFADLLSLVVFAILIFTGRQEIVTLKIFIDEIVYGLSDSAKAFIIILLTDVFVGFHSPHGWEVIIESALDHFGLPPNHNFINMFIATFPVMLDTVFKYWIFRYLNQISPSAVATYKNMNE
jgi:CemA family